MDKESLDHACVRRLLDPIEQGTTDMADAMVEVRADTYASSGRFEAALAAARG